MAGWDDFKLVPAADITPSCEEEFYAAIDAKYASVPPSKPEEVVEVTHAILWKYIKKSRMM